MNFRFFVIILVTTAFSELTLASEQESCLASLSTPICAAIEGNKPKNSIDDENIKDNDDHDSVDQNPDWVDLSLDWITETQEYVSQTVQNTAISIDRYISRDSFDEMETNESYLRLRFIERLAEAGNHTSEARISAKIDLPSSKRKVKLIFDSDPDDFDSLEQKQRGIGVGTELFDNKTNEATVGLAIEEDLLGDWKMSLGGGVRLRSVLDPYTRLRFTRHSELNEQWRTRFRETVFYFDSKGWGAETEVDFYRPLGNDRLFHVSLGGKYLDSENNWEWIQGLSLNHRLNRNNAIEYQLGVSANSNPNIQVSNYWLRSKWQHRLYKDWLYFNAVPEVTFPREKSFSATYQINFELEMFFSKDPDLRNRRIRY